MMTEHWLLFLRRIASHKLAYSREQLTFLARYLIK